MQYYVGNDIKLMSNTVDVTDDVIPACHVIADSTYFQ